MTRLVIYGAETGDLTEIGTDTVPANTAMTVVSATPAPTYGNYCLKAATTSSVASAVFKSISLDANQTDLWFRFHLYLHGLATTTKEGFWSVKDDVGTIHLLVGLDPSTGILSAFRGALSTVIASGGVITQDAWHLIEIHATIDDATGICEVWVDGTRIINFSGDTRNAGNANMRSFQIGRVGSASSTTLYMAFDDLVVNNTAGAVNNGQPGDGKVIMIVPSGAGDSTQIASRGGADSGANWSQLEEVPASSSDYVFDATVGHQDLYAMSNPAGLGTINAISIVALAQKSDNGAAQIGLTQKNGVTVTEDAAQSLATAWTYYRDIHEIVPGGAAYTPTDLNNIQAGVTIR